MSKIKILYCFIILLATTFIEPVGAQKSESKIKNLDADSTVTISISAVGDLMCHLPEIEYAKEGNDSLNFSSFFSYIKKYWKNSSLVMGNLETVIAGKNSKYSGYPLFNSPEQFVEALRNSGFNLITTANNHALDRGVKGVFNTLEALKKNNINYEGTFLSQRDKDSLRIFNLKGIRLAVLAYTYGVNNNYIPPGSNYIINFIDTLQIKNDISSARRKGADFVLVYFHFGTQYKRQPDAFQQEIVKKTIDYGADIILGGHPHVLEPCGFYKTKNAKLDTGFVIYSLGNFISNQMQRYTDAGVVLNISITKDFAKNSFHISSVTAVPTYVFKGETSSGDKYYILPAEAYSDTTLKFLTPVVRKDMEQAFSDTKKILPNIPLR